MGATLVELRIGDEPAAWGRAGFAVDGDVVRVGAVRLRLVGESEGRGILSWALDGVADASVDGLPAHEATAVEEAADANPNGVHALDHVVVTSPDLDRTIDALVATGLELRRVRDLGARQQAFFWLGEPILELVGPKEPSGTGPSRFWGLACTVDDIDRTAASLGEACGQPKDAVQPGRRIATLRHEPLGMSVPVAFMTPHVRSGR